MKKAVITMAILVSLLIAIPAVRAPPPRHCYGLDVWFYETDSKAFAALKAGEVDFIQWALTFEQYTEATQDPSLQLAKVDEMGMYEIDINNNYSIPTYPGVRSPTHDANFRKAIACAVNKPWIITDVLKGFGARIDVPIAAPNMGWADPSTYYPNYDWEYNMTKAAELLDAAGFVDTDGNGKRNYPTGWPGREDGPDLDPIIACIRSDHAHRLIVGRALADNLRALGIPVTNVEGSSSVLFPKVMAQFDYHWYTGGWSLGRYPLNCYTQYHSDYYYPNGPNYVTGYNENGEPNYPDVDEVVERIYYAESLEDAIAACKEFTVLFEEHCIIVPLWSYSSYWAYRKNVVGIVNMFGYGLENSYTFLNAYKVDDPATPKDESKEPLRFGTINPPKALNILHSQWYFDYAVLDRIFASGMAVEPYVLANDNPWIFQDWQISTWIGDDGKEKTKVTYWIRKDVMWHAPETGAEVRLFTAHDLEFTIWFIYSVKDSWHFSSMQDVDHTVVVNDYCLEVYFVDKSIWFYTSPTYPLLPRNEYLPLFCGTDSATVVSDGTNCTAGTEVQFTPGSEVDSSAIDIISVTHSASGALVEGVDYTIEVVSPKKCHNVIHFLKDQAAGTITINYYKRTQPTTGYYLGGQDWKLWMYSIGPYYPIAVEPTLGYASLNCNPSHFLESIPLGEIDFMWNWQGTTKPRSGYFQIFVYDAVKLLGAYCSRGDAVPSANWFPGADIDPTDLCHVGLYDAVILLGKYGQKFGSPPP